MAPGLKYAWRIFLFVLLVPNSKAQCLQPVASYTYDCLTSSALASVTVIPPLGNPPYTYTWVPGAYSTASVSNLPMGTYTIFVKDANNCMYYTMLIIVNPYTPSNLVFTSTMVSCYGGNDGASKATFNGSNGPPYTYTWSQGGTALYHTQSVNNLTAGKYVVTVKDKNGCGVTNTVTITEPPQINSVLTPTYIACAGSTVQAAMTSTGGAGPYTYSLNGVSVSPPAALSAGLQTLTTKDSKNCIRVNTVTVIEEPPDKIAFQVFKPSCRSVPDGSVTATASGSYSPFSYQWLGNGFPPGNTLDNIYPGTYTVSVTNATGCVTRSVIAVTPLASVLPTVSTRSENCSAADGAFTIALSGGNPPYTLTTMPGAATGSVVSQLTTGTYTTIIRDVKNCTDTVQVVIGNLSTVVLSVSQPKAPLCYEQCTGSFDLNTINAKLPVTYSVSGLPASISPSFKNICAGSYFIKAIDAIGCPATTSLNFPTPPVFSYSANAGAPMCIGREATLTAAATGGTGAHSYVWNPGSITGSVIAVSPSVTTVYSLNVYDANKCTLAPRTVTVTVFPALSINIRSSDAGVCPGTTAQITPSISGGDGRYSYMWQPGNLTAPSVFVASITVSVYTLTVADACGSPPVTKAIPIRLFPVTKPVYHASADTGCLPLCTRFINLTPGTRNVVWNFGDRPYEQKGDTTDYCYDLPGSFNLRIALTDSNNCRSSFTFSNAVSVLQKPLASYISDPEVLTLNNSENVLFKNLSGHASAYAWFVNGIEQARSRDFRFSLTDTGCTDVRLVAYGEGCVDSVDKSICVSEGFTFYMPRAFTPNNDGLNDILRPKGSGWLFSNYRFEVYNRWGVKIFQTTDPASGWDAGIAPHRSLPDLYNSDPGDVYAWKVRLTDNEGNPHEFVGHVTLLK